MNKQIISILLILIIILSLSIQVTHAITPGTLTLQDTIYNKKTPGLAPNIYTITITPHTITIKGNIPLASQINNQQATINYAYTSYRITIPIDLDDNISTGVNYTITYYNGTTPVTYILPGVDIVLYYTGRIDNNGTTIINKTLIQALIYPTATLVNLTNTTTVKVSPGIIQAQINWTAIKQAYYNVTGKRITSHYHRIYIIAGSKNYPGTIFASTAMISERVIDQLECGPQTLKPVPNQTIILNGSLNAWPPESIYCNETGETLQPYPPYYDGRLVLLAKNATNLFLGFQMRGSFPDTSDTLVRINASAMFYINQTTNASFSIHVMTYSVNLFTAVYNPPVQNIYGISVSLPSGSLVPLPPLIEATIPLSTIGLNSTILDEAMLTGYQARIDMEVSNFLSTGSQDTPLQVKSLIIDDDREGAVLTGGPVSIRQYTLASGSPYTLTSQNMKIIIPNTTSTLTLNLGEIGTPAVGLKGLPSFHGWGFFYYFSLSNASAIIWPLQVYITLDSKYNASLIIPYYYNKTLHKYVRIPGSLVTVYPENNTIRITYTSQLYAAGDPSILLAYPSTIVGGEIQAQAASGDNVVLGYAGLSALLAFLLIIILLNKKYK